jgi:hypothetical protein
MNYTKTDIECGKKEMKLNSSYIKTLSRIEHEKNDWW